MCSVPNENLVWVLQSPWSSWYPHQTWHCRTWWCVGCPIHPPLRRGRWPAGASCCHNGTYRKASSASVVSGKHRATSLCYGLLSLQTPASLFRPISSLFPQKGKKSIMEHKSFNIFSVRNILTHIHKPLEGSHSYTGLKKTVTIHLKWVWKKESFSSIQLPIMSRGDQLTFMIEPFNGLLSVAFLLMLWPKEQHQLGDG